MEADARTCSILLVFLLLSSLLVCAIVTFPSARGSTLYVGGAGPGNYTGIWEALMDAEPGDTIFVHSGTYNENILINRSLSLVGENKETTIIYGGWRTTIINVSADWVNITGFTLEASGEGSWDSGVRLHYVQNCSIYSNNFSSNANGMVILHSNNSMVKDNTIYPSWFGYGIYLHDSSNNMIEDNNFFGSGIELNSGSDNIVQGNHILHSGISVYGSRNVVTRNNASESWGNGLSIGGSNHTVTLNNLSSHRKHGLSIGGSNHTVTMNSLSSNRETGIYLHHSMNSSISTNTVSFNGENGIHLYASRNNTIAENNVSTNNGSGISLYHSSEQTIDKNTIWGNGGDGIIVKQGCLNVITNNTVISNHQFGINVSNSEWATVAYNVISNNSNGIGLASYHSYLEIHIIRFNEILSNKHDGIHVAGSLGNLIENNSISHNGRHGIFLESSSYNVVANNTISLNERCGVGFYASSNNSVHDNTFVGNGEESCTIIRQKPYPWLTALVAAVGGLVATAVVVVAIRTWQKRRIPIHKP